MLKFSKYQGTGNDFVMIDNRQLLFPKRQTVIAQLCHRRFGIGADGLILLEKPTHTEDDFKMVYYNADGNESTMCGNGGRCLVKFAHDIGVIENKARFTAIDGPHEATHNQELVSLKMRDVSGYKKTTDAYIIDSGSPHYITFVENVAQINVAKQGRAIRNSPPFKTEGINVNFVEINNSEFKIRTYERGVEAETYSCGTGVTAAALALFISKNSTKEVTLHTQGGILQVHFEAAEKGFKNIWLTGPAEKTFTGELSL